MQTASPSKTKLLTEYAPLILFLIANEFYGIYIATGILVVATICSLAYSWMTSRKLPMILMVGCGAVVLFGLLTLIFANDIFIKMKPTVVSLIIALVLLLGLALKRNPLGAILGDSMPMKLDLAAWRHLTLIWIAMFITIALANEWAWRALSTEAWVRFKVFGLTGITLVFGVAAAIFLAKKQQ